MKRRGFLLFSFVASLLLAAALHLFSGYLKERLPHELTAIRWDEEGDTAHISVYFTESEKYALKQNLENTSFRLEGWYHQILQELQNASIALDEEASATARLAIYAYSASGEVSLSTEQGSTKVKAYGVGGDFFQFHPLKLVYGGYFSESDLMQDRIVIDTETAWKLFGSNDVAGMFVKINGIPHMVVGVYEREEGYFNDAAGNGVSSVYVSHKTLYQHGQYHGLETAEYLIPNPVSGFAVDLVQKQCSDMDVEIIEHQERFTINGLWNVMKQAGTRSMSLSGITFPYWENMARGYEDILAGLLFVEFVLLGYALIIFVSVAWYLWLHRRWRARDIFGKMQDTIYAARVKRYQTRLDRKAKKKAAQSDEELVFEDLE